MAFYVCRNCIDLNAAEAAHAADPAAAMTLSILPPFLLLLLPLQCTLPSTTL
jgi:hypothetical protein